jgi:hypothetical protein
MKYEVKRTDPFMVRAVGAYKPFAIRFRGALPHAGMRAGRWPTTFNIQHSTFNIQHSTFNIQHRKTGEVGRRALQMKPFDPQRKHCGGWTAEDGRTPGKALLTSCPTNETLTPRRARRDAPYRTQPFCPRAPDVVAYKRIGEASGYLTLSS